MILFLHVLNFDELIRLKCYAIYTNKQISRLENEMVWIKNDEIYRLVTHGLMEEFNGRVTFEIHLELSHCSFMYNKGTTIYINTLNFSIDTKMLTRYYTCL